METEPAQHPLTPDELVDEASMGSFPASDPPSYWARDATPARKPLPASDEQPDGESRA